MHFESVQKELKIYWHAMSKSGLVLARTMTESRMPGSACCLLTKLTPRYDRLVVVNNSEQIQLCLVQWQTRAVGVQEEFNKANRRRAERDGLAQQAPNAKTCRGAHRGAKRDKGDNWGPYSHFTTKIRVTRDRCSASIT